MASGLLLNQKNIEYLMVGYSRRNVSRTTHVPFDLCQLFVLFYNETVYWTLKDEDLDNFFKCSLGEYIDGQEFQIKEVPFKLQIYPNGNEKSVEGHVYLSLQILINKLPKYIIL